MQIFVRGVKTAKKKTTAGVSSQSDSYSALIDKTNILKWKFIEKQFEKVLKIFSLQFTVHEQIFRNYYRNFSPPQKFAQNQISKHLYMLK